MILEILPIARRIDKKLEETLGRPYRVVLSVGLIVEIVDQVHGLTHASFGHGHWVQTSIWIVFMLLLLINQLGELANRMDNRPPRGMRQRSATGADAAEIPGVPSRASLAAEGERGGSQIAD